MEIRLYNHWKMGADFEFIGFSIHNCGNCTGFGAFVLGFGFVVRW